VKSNNSEEKKIHYNLTNKFFKESATYKMGYYDAKNKLSLKHDPKQYKIWEICTSFIDKQIKNNKKILKVIDVGCGIGDFSLDLAKRYPNLNKIIGIDILDEIIEIARKKEELSDKITILKGDLLDLEFDDKSFDLSICINVFHHIHPKDFEKAVKELSRITDKYVILEIRNKKNIFNFYYKYFALRFYYNNLPVTACSIEEVNNLFKRQNFKLLFAKGIYPRTRICRRLILIYKREKNY
jgi:ubiquinone/menaquinone biosynthesis C-methylase UbiE